jgi:hypothetical protein
MVGRTLRSHLRKSSSKLVAIVTLAAFAALAPSIASAQQAKASAPSSPASARVPDSLTVPQGTELQLRTEDVLSSAADNDNRFFAMLVAPVVVDGWVVARAGEYVTGDVSAPANFAGSQTATVKLTLSKFMLVDGRTVPIQAAPVEVPSNLAAFSRVTFRIDAPVQFATARNRWAFRVVTQNDFTHYPLGSAPSPLPAGYDPPCCLDQHAVGAFKGDGYGYPYYYSAAYFPPPVAIAYYGWHGTRWGW